MAESDELGGYSDSTIEDSDVDVEELPLLPVEEDSNHEDSPSTAGGPVEPQDRISVQDEPGAAALPDAKQQEAEAPLTRGKRSHESDSEDDVDSRSVCPICMEKWTNSGEHRLVCLRCGHLFGYSCIVRWLEIGCFSGQRRCPQCNKRATKRDIRTLYVHNLQVLDTTECEKLKEELASVKQEKMRLEMELARVNINNQLRAQELKEALSKIQTLENQIKTQAIVSTQQCSQQRSQSTTISRMSLEKSLQISTSGGCRVLVYNPLTKQLYVSYSASNTLFSGFCIKGIDMIEGPKFSRNTLLHSKAIRDLAFQPESHNVLLSVSLDRTAKLFDLSSNGIINKFVIENPVWSCCWDSGNLDRFFIGCQNGSVLQYDMRQPTSPLNRLTVTGDSSPVTSLQSLPSQGGLLVSKLVSCWAYSVNNANEYQGQQLPLEGPFTSLCYDKESDHVLISRRPNSNNRNICHILCHLEQSGSTLLCNTIRTFLGGSAQMQLSRPCFVKTDTDTLVAAYIESAGCINAWSVSSGQVVATVKAHDPVKDICAFNVEGRQILAALSEQTLRLYSML